METEEALTVLSSLGLSVALKMGWLGLAYPKAWNREREVWQKRWEEKQLILQLYSRLWW